MFLTINCSSVLGHPPTIMQYIGYFRFFDDVMFPHNGAYSVGTVDVSAVLEQLSKISNVFARGRLLFDFVIVCIGRNCAPELMHSI